jgi:stage II sporulation SpoAA-like protein
MPVVLSFEEPSLFILRASGEVTYDEVNRALDQMLADAHFQKASAIFIDNRGVTRTPSIPEVAMITKQFSVVFSRGVVRVALLTDSAAVYAVSLIFSAFASTVGAQARVFRDEAKARAWVAAAGSSGIR